MGMLVPYEETGRVNQKVRTRDALIAATRELLAQGVTPTMEGAAAAAAISRTTAYRYFPNLRALLVAAYPHIEQRSLLGPEPPQDPAARLAIVSEDQTLRVLKYEPEMRAVLRLSLEADSAGGPKLPMNRGLRIGWIEDALTPLRGQMPRRQAQAADLWHRRHTRHRSVRLADRHRPGLARGRSRGHARQRQRTTADRDRGG